LRARHSGCGLSDIGYLWSNPNQNDHEMMMKIIREGHESRLAKYCFSEKMTVTHMSWSHIIAYNQTSYGIDHGNMCQQKVDQCKNQIVGRNLRIVAHWWTLLISWHMLACPLILKSQPWASATFTGRSQKLIEGRSKTFMELESN